MVGERRKKKKKQSGLKQREGVVAVFLPRSDQAGAPPSYSNENPLFGREKKQRSSPARTEDPKQQEDKQQRSEEVQISATSSLKKRGYFFFLGEEL